MRRNPDHPDQSAPLVLDGENLSLKEISIDGRALTDNAYSIEDNKLTIDASASQTLVPPVASFSS